MADPVVQLDLPVVGFDLRGEQIEAESEALDVLAGDGGPVGVGSADRCADQVPVAPENFAR